MRRGVPPSRVMGWADENTGVMEVANSFPNAEVSLLCLSPIEMAGVRTADLRHRSSETISVPSSRTGKPGSRSVTRHQTLNYQGPVKPQIRGRRPREPMGLPRPVRLYLWPVSRHIHQRQARVDPVRLRVAYLPSHPPPAYLLLLTLPASETPNLEAGSNSKASTPSSAAPTPHRPNTAPS